MYKYVLNVNCKNFSKNKNEKDMALGTSLVVQQPRLRGPNVGDPSLVPGQGTRSHML